MKHLGQAIRAPLCLTSAGLLLIAANAAFATPTLTLTSGVAPVATQTSAGGSLVYSSPNFGGWTINSIKANGTPFPMYGNAQNPSMNLTANVKSSTNPGLQPLVINFTDDNFSDPVPVDWVGSLSANALTSGMTINYAALLNGTPLGAASTTALTTPSVYANVIGGTYTILTPYSLSLVITITPNTANPNAADVGFNLDAEESPEPAMYGVLGIGLCGLAYFRYRQRA
jgi:hypothetical protein